MLFSLYQPPLRQIINSYNITGHLYSNDTQLRFTFIPSETFRLSRPLDCLNGLRDQLTKYFLQLNADKTEVLLAALEKLYTHSGQHWASFFMLPAPASGVLFDQCHYFC